MSGLALQPGMLTSAAASGFNPLDPKWAAVGVLDMGTDVLNGSGSPAVYNEPIAEWRNQITDGILSDAQQATEGFRPIYLPKGDNGTYAHLPGLTDNYLAVPDSESLRISGDLEIVAKVKLVSWASGNKQTFVGKWNNANGNNRGYLLHVNETGELDLGLSVSGSDSSSWLSTVPTGLSDGATSWVKATFRVSDSRIQYFLSNDGVSWSQLGSDVTATGITGINQNTEPLSIGAINISIGGQNIMEGKVHRAMVSPTIDGAPVLDINIPVDAPDHGVTSFTCTTGQPVSVSRDGWNPTTIIGRNIGRTDGTGDFLQAVYSVPASAGRIFFFVGTLNNVDGIGRLLSLQDNAASGDIGPTSFVISYPPPAGVSSYYDGSTILTPPDSTPENWLRFTHEVGMYSGGRGYFNGSSSVDVTPDVSAVSGDTIYIAARNNNGTMAAFEAMDIEAIYDFPDPGSESLRTELRNGIESIYQTYF